MTFIVGDIIKISNGDAFYNYLGTDFVEKYVPNLSHLYKVGKRPIANNQNFVIISKTEYDWVYIIQEVDTGAIYVASRSRFRLVQNREDIIISS